jgi:hypothetical protein
MCIPILLEVPSLIDSYHHAIVRAGLSADDELPTSSPVIASIGLMQV